MKPIVAIMFMVLVVTSVGLCDEPLPTRYLEKITSTPDFCQGDQRFGKFPGNGDQICAPTALSNSLVWLDQHGFPKILNKPDPTMADQAELIRLLCQGEFLATDMEMGTPMKKVVLGIEKFFETVGYDCHVEQMSWRSSTRRIGEIPDEKWMLKSCMGNSSLLINIGWYKLDKNAYRRFDGHWVTLVGFREENGKHILLVHDPCKRGGNDKQTEACRLIPLPPNNVIQPKEGKPISVKGRFKLDGIRIKREMDLAIVDGAVAFTPTKKTN